MHTARNQESGANIALDDSKLHEDQQSSRTRSKPPNSQTSFQPGDTVTHHSPQPKHKTRDMYLVTKTQPDQVTVQRILHSVSDQPTKIMSKEYVTHPKRLHLLHRPPPLQQSLPVQLDIPHAAQPQRTVWSPINSLFYHHTDEDSDTEEEDENDADPIPAVQADHPSPHINQDAIQDTTDDDEDQSSDGRETESSPPSQPTQEPTDTNPRSPASSKQSEPPPSPRSPPDLIITPPQPGLQTEEEHGAEPDYSFLELYQYNQERPPKKGDIIHYYDADYSNWMRVRIISKSNYHHYFNIRFLDINREDVGIYFKPGESWSHSHPQLLPPAEQAPDSPDLSEFDPYSPDAADPHQVINHPNIHIPPHNKDDKIDERETERATLSTSWCARSPWPKPLGQGVLTFPFQEHSAAGPRVRHRTHHTCGEGPHVGY